MEGFKHLEREGTDYIVKQYVSLQHIIVMIWALISIVVIINTSYLKTGIIMLIFSLLLTFVAFMPSRVSFNFISKNLTVVNRGLNRRKFTYELNDFEGFGLQTIRFAIIPLGCFLYADFKNVSHFKRPVISQSFSKKKMQEIINELEDLKKTQ